MNQLLISYIMPIIAAVAMALGIEKYRDSTSMYLCKHQYALCTSAICVPQPGEPTKAICFCDVEEGMSMSTTPCDNLKPSVDSHGIQTVYSTFSLKQFDEGKKGMKCPNGTPWTWCLNKRCTVDPSNSKKAICTCDVLRTKEWMTLGGNCDTSTCNTGYWSGAAMKDFEEGNIFIMKTLHLERSPAKWCQVVSP